MFHFVGENARCDWRCRWPISAGWLPAWRAWRAWLSQAPTAGLSARSIILSCCHLLYLFLLYLAFEGACLWRWRRVAKDESGSVGKGLEKMSLAPNDMASGTPPNDIPLGLYIRRPTWRENNRTKPTLPYFQPDRMSDGYRKAQTRKMDIDPGSRLTFTPTLWRE